MSGWTESDKECYPEGIETPYWIIGVGFITSLFINSFILFSGQSLTTKAWNTVKSWICNCSCCCSLSSEANSNNPPVVTQVDANHVSICAFYFCCQWIHVFSSCCAHDKRKAASRIKFPSIIKLSINKNKIPHLFVDSEYEYDSDEYDEEFEDSMVTHRNTFIDLSVQEMMLNQEIDDLDDDDDDDDDASTRIINKHDISLTGTEISGYYRLLKRKDDIAKYGYPVYQSTHASLAGYDYVIY